MKAHPTSPPADRRGAYGHELAGLEGADDLLVEAGPDWFGLEVAARRGEIGGARDQVDENRATLVLLGAVALVERAPARAEFVFENEPSFDAVVHPYLGPVAGLVAHWHGRESIHAGAFVLGGGVWGLLSERGGGKSSTLARLALEGVSILSDDVLVVDGGTAFAGPRTIDLRREPARALGVGEPLGVVGTRERWRLRLDQVPGALPLHGWVFLSWADELGFRRVPAGERFQRLVEARTILLSPQDPTALLDLASRPAFELRRPREWSSLEEATKLLLASLP